MGLRILSIIPMIKIPEKISNIASIIAPFANKTKAIGSQTIMVPTAGTMLNNAMTAPQIRAPSIPSKRSVK